VAELLALRISDLDVHESDADAATHNRRIRVQGGDRFESRHRRKDGTVFDVEVSAQHLPDAGGRFVGFLRDITDRKRAEAALRESEERYRALTEHSLSAVATHEVVLDDAGRPVDYVFVSANAAFETFTGLRVQDILGRRVTEVIPGIEPTGLIECYGQVALTGEAFAAERYIEPLGRHYLLNAYGLGNRRFATAFIDITDRKRAEDALRESEAKLARALEQAHLAYWEFDDASATFTFNDRFYALYGTTAEREGGHAMHAATYASAFMLPGEERKVADAVATLEQSDCDEHQLEHRIRRRDGEIRHIVVRFAAVRDTTGRIVGSRGANQDVTELKGLEAQLQQAQKMDSVGRLAGGVAHDFNNMLGVIIGHVDLALKDVNPSQPLHRDLIEIRSAATRSADLTRQLLAFARQQTVAPRALDLNDTIEKSLSMLRRLIGESVELVWRPSRQPWWVMVDPAQIDQVLTNLCVNARDAIADVGVVTIETDSVTFGGAPHALQFGAIPGEFVRLSVTDNGCGMDRETQTRVFEPFFTTKPLGKGTGLGLSTVYGIAKQNEGFVDLFSEPGIGTTLSVYLPRHVAAGVPSLAPAAVAPEPSGHEVILLVEDDPALLKLSRRILTGSGYQVRAASSPTEALAVAGAADVSIHLLVTDVVMPEMNGRELASRLAVLQPGARRLFTSGYPADVIAHHGVLDDGVHFIQKPFSPDDLLAKVRDVLSRG
jgi:PAS domain S-box-containing protein